MSDGKKRSRKTKLEVRNDADIDEMENTILQACPNAKMLRCLIVQPKVYDHDYSVQDASAPSSPTQLVQDAPAPSSPTQPAQNAPALSSPIQLSVKVEVEEFDESIMEIENANSSDDVDVKTGVPPEHLMLNSKRRSRGMIHVFHVDIEKMYKISEHVKWSSSNPADKFLDMELKNSWGRVLRDSDSNDPHNELIQKALRNWGLKLINGRIWRESPLFYQCHICTLAWWHLDPFREHIRRHDHKTLKVYNLENNQESVIIASNTFSTKPTYIPCEGNCYRCGKPFDFHVKNKTEMYTCVDCNDSAPTCSLLQYHHLHCVKKKIVQYPKPQKCRFCSATFIYIQDLLDHMPFAHAVRSDIPAPFYFKTCSICQKKYHHFYIHMCTKSYVNSSCKHCYRRFSMKLVADSHLSLQEKNYKCTICNEVLPSKCMETEHMLLHTNNYRMAYRCITPTCRPTMLFPDETSVRLHKLVYHKQKFDKRRGYYEKILIPEKCAKPEGVLDSDHITTCIQENKGIKPDDTSSTSVNETLNSSVDTADKEFKQEDVHVKQEIEEMMTYIDSESQEDASDYEQMLSKVFKVSDSVLDTQQRCETTEINGIIKTEQEEIDFENLIDMQDNPITIKKEPIDTETFYEMCTEEVCDFEDTSHMIELRNTNETRDKSSGIYDADSIKIEPEDNEDRSRGSGIKIIDTFTETPDSGVRHLKLEPDGPKENTIMLEIYNNKSLLKSLNPALKSDAENNTATKEKQIKSMKKFKKAKLLDSNGVRQRRMYTCTKCGYKNVHKLYRIHIDSLCKSSPTEDLNNKYKCTKCDSTFSSVKSYLLHFPRHGYQVLRCPVCVMKFESFKEYLQHFNRHVRRNFVNLWMITKELVTPTMKQLKCQKCSRVVLPEDIFTHWEGHLKLKPDHEPVQAPLESDTNAINNKSDKSLHPTVLDMALRQLYTIGHDKECLVCNRTFARRHDCKRHVIEHLLLDAYCKKVNSQEKTFRCQICTQDFQRIELYKFHMREHGSLPVYRCDRCDKTFSDSSNFAKHKKIHSLEVLICDICKKKFHAKTSLEKHMLEHQKIGSLKCEQCPKQFYTTSQFKKHIKACHYNLPKFKCVLCDMSFDSLRQKWDHAWTEHKERKQKADCPLCNLEFRKFYDVKKHVRTEHKVDISFYNIKSDPTVKIIKTYSKIKRMKGHERKKELETFIIHSDFTNSE